MGAKEVMKILTMGLLLGFVSGCDSPTQVTSLNRTEDAGATPTIQSISPAGATALTSDLTLTLTGSNFVDGNDGRSSVKWWINNQESSLATQVISSTALTAVVPAALLAIPGSARVAVVNGESRSVDLVFPIAIPQPTLTAISPTSATGGSVFTLTVAGTNFLEVPFFKSMVRVSGDDGEPWWTIFPNTIVISRTELRLAVSQFSDWPTDPGRVSVVVVNVDFRSNRFEGPESNAAFFDITAPGHAAALVPAGIMCALGCPRPLIQRPPDWVFLPFARRVQPPVDSLIASRATVGGIPNHF
jgi:hypothetical protein